MECKRAAKDVTASNSDFQLVCTTDSCSVMDGTVLWLGRDDSALNDLLEAVLGCQLAGDHIEREGN